MTVAAFAQQSAPPAKPPDKAAATPAAKAEAAVAVPAKADDQAKAAEAAKAEEQAAPPAPLEKSKDPEQWITGSFDFGYRWVSDVRGSLPTYRSIVNLGAGPKLTGLDLIIKIPEANPIYKLVDRIDARAYAWGGDPYNTAHIDVSKKEWYQLRGDYRNKAYFNALPSFANPLAPGGFDERSFDVRRRSGSIQLDVSHNKHILPYLVFERNSGYGHGVETWVQDSNNEFAVPMLLRDSTNTYRGGLRFAYSRWNVTLEEGRTTYKDDAQASFNGTNYGDRTTPILGGTLVLNTLRQTYGIRGSSLYTRALATASPFPWIDLNGQFLYSKPKTDARYFDIATGNFALLSSLLLYSGQYDTGAGASNAKRTLGNADLEIRPLKLKQSKKLRFVDSFSSSRYDQKGAGALTEQILLTPGATFPALVSALDTPQAVTYNQQQLQAFWRITAEKPTPTLNILLRGGYRYVWGDATVRAGTLDQSGPQAFGALQRNVGLAGATIRGTFSPPQTKKEKDKEEAKVKAGEEKKDRAWKFALNVDYELARTSQNYFRTSLYNYHKLRGRAKFESPGSSLWFQANFALLDNQNPTPGVQNDFLSRENSLAVFWRPNGVKWTRVMLMAEYARSTLYSNIDFLLLPFYVPSVSNYRENAHTATSTIDIVFPKVGGIEPKLTAGGSLFISSGSRASRYYQPLGRLSLPLQKHIQWNTEWRWYGFGEQLYMYEGFRAHIFMTGLKLIR